MAKQDLTLHVSGMKDLVRKLEAAPDRVKRKVARTVLRAGAAVIRDGARQRVRVRTGSLKKKITVAERNTGKGGPVVMSIGVAKGSFVATTTKTGKVRFRRLKKTEVFQGKRVTPSRYYHLVERHDSYLRAARDGEKTKAFAAVAAKGREALAKAAVEIAR